jgi:hypothetical protein
MIGPATLRMTSSRWIEADLDTVSERKRPAILRAVGLYDSRYAPSQRAATAEN